MPHELAVPATLIQGAESRRLTLFQGADPLKWTQEFVVIAVVLVALSVCYRYRSRIIFLLTGDDKIHGSSLDVCYFTFCKCCGMCNGEWTRHLTSCFCCPTSIHKRNLVKELARCCGMSTKTVEIKNIVVGDLPYDKARGDFYVAISVGTNPDMVTALQEEKMPKCIHFPEILQLKMRDSPLEPRVVVTVKELNIAGSETLCELTISPCSIIDWRSDNPPLKRFQMKVVNSSIERETPPWIAMEISDPSENRHLETLPNIFSLLKVRTFMPANEQMAAAGTAMHGPQNAYAHPAEQKKQSIMTSDGTILGTREQKDYNTTEFKYKYTLLDDSGNPVEEPDEADITAIRRRRQCVMVVFGCWDCLTTLLILGYILFRLYVWSCYRQFVWMTMAELNGRKLPISNKELKDLVTQCHQSVDGTGAQTGTPCRPDYAQTLNVCNTVPEINRPEAFVGLVFNLIGVKIKGITCFHGICDFRNSLVDYDWIMIWGCLGLILMTRMCKCWANQCVKDYKRRLQSSHGKDLQHFRDQQNSMKSGSGFMGGGMAPRPQGGMGMGGMQGGGMGMGMQAAPPGGYV